MAMKWISQYCNKVKYILKVDDDIVSNIFILLRHLKSFDNHKIMKQKTIMCLVWVGIVLLHLVIQFYFNTDLFHRLEWLLCE